MTSNIYKENDNTYLNIVINGALPIYNGTTTLTNEQNVIAEYSVTKTTPIIDYCSDYYCSVIRFTIPLNTIPILICPIIPNQPYPNLTPLIFGIYNGLTYSLFVNYISESNHGPPAQNQLTQVITDYYYIYYYEQFINMVNITLNTLWINSGLQTIFPTVTQPYFVYNSGSGLISMIVPQCFVNITSPLITIPVIFMNEASIQFFDTFPLKFYDYNQPSGRDYDFIFNYATQIVPPVLGVNPVLETNAYAPYNGTITSPPSYYRFFQNYQTTFIWSSLRKLILSSTSIPIFGEFTPSSLNGSLNNSFPVLTDFVPNIELPGQSRGIAYYNPKAQYRLIDLISTSPLQKIDIRIYWEDKLGNLYPLTISAGQQASIKLAFLRKSLYKASNLLK